MIRTDPMRALRAALVTSLVLALHPLRAQHIIRSVTADDGKPSAFNAVVDSLILTSPDSASIGNACPAAYDHQRRAYLEGGTSAYLWQVIKRLVPSGTSSGEHLVLKINTLHVSELKHERGQCSFAGMNIEFLERRVDGWVRRYIHGTTTWHQQGDATSHHGYNVVRALRECLSAYATARATERLTAIPVAAADLSRPPVAGALQLPIQLVGSPAEGVYHSFMRMANNDPEVVHHLTLNEHENTDDGRALSVKGPHAEDARSWWGLCHDGIIYMNNGRRFVELQRDATGFFTRTEVGIDNTTATAAMGVVSGVFLGVVGAALIVASTDQPKRPTRLDLDLLTGQLVPSEVIYAREEVGSSRTLFIADSTLKGRSAYVLVYGGEEVRLMAGQYHDLELTVRGTPVPLEVRVDGQTRSFGLDTKSHRNNAVIIGTASDGSLSVDLLNDEAAQAARSSLRPELEVK